MDSIHRAKKKKRTSKFIKEKYDWKEESRHIFDFAHRMCRYCKKPGDLVTPCFCEGERKYVHYECLKKSIIIGDRARCEFCNYSYVVEEKRRALKNWSFRNVAKHDVRKLRKNILMLFIAVGTMVAAAILTAQTYLHPKEHEKSELYGKISIMIFLMLGTIAFAALQMIWYRKFYKKLIRSNRDIDVEIGGDLRRRSYLSVIGELDEENGERMSLSSWASRRRLSSSMQSVQNNNSLRRPRLHSERHKRPHKGRLEDALMRESSPPAQLRQQMTSRDCTIYYQPKLSDAYMYMN